MKVSNLVSSLLGRFTVTGLALSAIFVLSGCTSQRGGTKIADPLTVGTLSVSVGFGAVSSPPYRCEGEGTVTIRPSTGGAKPEKYSFSGLSKNESPACSTSLTFENLPPGQVQISDSHGASCTKVITADQFTSVSIRADVLTCQ